MSAGRTISHLIELYAQLRHTKQCLGVTIAKDAEFVVKVAAKNQKVSHLKKNDALQRTHLDIL